MATSINQQDPSALIDNMEVARLCGNKNPHFAFDQIARDHLFPKPVITGRRGRGSHKSLWKRSDILAWKQQDSRRTKRSDGHRMAFYGNFLPPIDRELATQFIRGRFDCEQNQICQIRRIIRARTHGATIITRIRTVGDWS